MVRRVVTVQLVAKHRSHQISRMTRPIPSGTNSTANRNPTGALRNIAGRPVQTTRSSVAIIVYPLKLESVSAGRGSMSPMHQYQSVAYRTNEKERRPAAPLQRPRPRGTTEQRPADAPSRGGRAKHCFCGSRAERRLRLVVSLKADLTLSRRSSCLHGRSTALWSFLVRFSDYSNSGWSDSQRLSNRLIA